jgi:hypothetical protein
MAFTLSETNAVEYLLGVGLIPTDRASSASARELGGGISNIVVRVNFAGQPDGLAGEGVRAPGIGIDPEVRRIQSRVHGGQR